MALVAPPARVSPAQPPHQHFPAFFVGGKEGGHRGLLFSEPEPPRRGISRGASEVFVGAAPTPVE